MATINKRVCYVVCYKDPNYIRTQTLTAALRQIPGVQLIEVRNRYLGALRYAEVPIKLIWTRIKFKPSMYFIGFRGQDCFWLLYPAMIGKPKIFDEFVNLHDYLVSEHRKFKKASLPIKILDSYMRWIIGRCYKTLADTPAHAKLSSDIYGIRPDKFISVPVGADEATFKPLPKKSDGPFTVLFYGTMLPLHGMEYLLEAIRLLKERKELDDAVFKLIGGRGNPKMQKLLDNFISTNGLENNVSVTPWVDYKDLPAKIAEADLCLGGPFGLTGQASRVITGKTYQFLAMRKPTLIGRSPATVAFKDRDNCILVQRGSADSLADAISWAMKNRRELARIGDRGKDLYEKEFSTQAISQLLKREIND